MEIKKEEIKILKKKGVLTDDMIKCIMKGKEKRDINVKKRKCDECRTYNQLDEIKDDTYCKNCGKWLN